MVKNKAQITLFLILGFVIFVAFGFIYYVYGLSHKDKIEIEAEKTTKISFSIDNVNNFLNNCFKNLASEGVDYVSLRGGISLRLKNLTTKALSILPIIFMKTAVYFPT